MSKRWKNLFSVKFFKLFIVGGIACVAWNVTSPAMAQTAFPSNAEQNCVLKHDEFVKLQKVPRLEMFAEDLGEFGDKIKKFNKKSFYDKANGLVYIFPPDGPGFKSGAKHCEFYKWGSQMFLWLTSTLNDTVYTEKDAHKRKQKSPDAKTDFVFASEFLYEVAVDPNKRGGKIFKAQTITAKTGVPKPTNPESTGQAGKIEGVLTSQNTNTISKHSSLVYYGIHTNRLYGYFRNSQAPGSTDNFPSRGYFPIHPLEKNNTACELVKKGVLEEGTKLAAIPALLLNIYCPLYGFKKAPDSKKGITLQQLEPAIDFLTMVLELKTSWVEASSLKNPSKYILQMGNIPTYTGKGKLNGTKEVKLALVGMHVVGTVENHPEMIWATIEHVDNAPNQKYTYLNKKGKPTSSTPKNREWLFSNGKEVALNKEELYLNRGNITDSKGHPMNNIKTKFGKTNVKRIHPWGNDAGDPKAAEKSSLLISLNNSVMGLLKTTQSSDPRQYYFLSGAVWNKDGEIPTKKTKISVSGSHKLANTTMETFQQKNGCFHCHQKSAASDAGTSISHIFDSLSRTLPKNK